MLINANNMLKLFCFLIVYCLQNHQTLSFKTFWSGFLKTTSKFVSTNFLIACLLLLLLLLFIMIIKFPVVHYRWLPLLSVNTLSGLVAPSWLPSPPSSRCGSAKTSTRRPDPPLSTGSASKPLLFSFSSVLDSACSLCTMSCPVFVLQTFVSNSPVQQFTSTATINCSINTFTYFQYISLCVHSTFSHKLSGFRFEIVLHQGHRMADCCCDIPHETPLRSVY